MNAIHKSQLVLAISVALMSGLAIKPDVTARSAGYSHFRDQGAPPEWRRYTVRDEEFSVLLPVVPAMSTTTMYVDKKTNRRERILGAYANGVVYIVLTFEKKSLSFDDIARQYASGQTEPVTVDGIAGRSIRSDDEDRMGATEVFATAKNLYVFKAQGSKLGNPAIGIPKFLSSIKLGRRPEGVEVREGPGEQPISESETNQANSLVLSGKDVTRKATIFTKPEPSYTEEARLSQTTGTVVLRAVFSSSGAVTNIRALSKLPNGLTEKAIGAARQIRFIPAIKDGRFVSMYFQLEYNFNLY